jgi:hypothetical protein
VDAAAFLVSLFSVRRDVDPALLSAVEHFVVLGVSVEASEHLSCLRGNVRDGGVRADEIDDGLLGLEPHDGHELDLVWVLSSNEIDRQETWDRPGLDAGDDDGANYALIRVGVLVCCVSMPGATDHASSLT